MHKLTCIFYISYIDGTQVKAYVRFYDHVPRRLQINGIKTLSAAFLRYLFDTWRSVNTLEIY